MRSACCAWSRTAAEPELPMSGHAVSSAARPDWDAVLVDIVDYVRTYPADSPLALETARYCLIDTLGCGLEALEYPACTKRSEEHTSELQSLMRISYAVFCLKKKTQQI